VRAKAYYSQKFVEKTGSIPYGFVPNYNNYADKRKYSVATQKPFTDGRIEPVIMYFQPFNTFWEDRRAEIYIYAADSILDMYHTIQEKNKNKMDSDELIKKETSHDPQKDQDFEIHLDYYKAIVSIKGCLAERKLKKILQLFEDWNLIEWRIPTTLSGIDSQMLALDYDFQVVGYNPGSHLKNKIDETILFNYFPNGVDFTQFTNLNLTENNGPIVNSVLDSLEQSEK
jgi:hypothetical protein